MARTLRLKSVVGLPALVNPVKAELFLLGSNVLADTVEVVELDPNFGTYEGLIDAGVAAGDYEITLYAWHSGTSAYVQIGTDDVTIGAAAGTYSAGSASEDPATAQGSVVDGENLTLRRGDSISQSLTLTGSIVGWTEIWLTGKSGIDAPDYMLGLADSEADFQIKATEGLVIISGGTPEAGETGTITVVDEVDAEINFTLSPAASKLLGIFRRGRYDVQVAFGANVVETRREGYLFVTADVTEAVS